MGIFYGRQMWLAGGGPAEEIVRLEATAKQKAERAAALDATDPQEAARLRGHIPKIEARLAKARRLQQQVAAGGFSPRALAVWEFAKFCGEVFLQALTLLVIPLVVTSMVCGITSLGDIRHIGRIGGLTVVYFMATTPVAVLIGIVLVQTIQPGVGADDTFAYVSENVLANEESSASETLLDVVRGRPGDPNSGMIPSNIFAAAAEMNVLALIVFALVFGGAVTTLGERGKIVVDFFNAANDAIMKMVHLVIWFAPVGIFGLVAYNIAKKGGGEAFAANWPSSASMSPPFRLDCFCSSVFLCLILWLIGRTGAVAVSCSGPRRRCSPRSPPAAAPRRCR